MFQSTNQINQINQINQEQVDHLAVINRRSWMEKFTKYSARDIGRRPASSSCFAGAIQAASLAAWHVPRFLKRISPKIAFQTRQKIQKRCFMMFPSTYGSNQLVKPVDAESPTAWQSGTCRGDHSQVK
jgi:hypothetical protein